PAQHGALVGSASAIFGSPLGRIGRGNSFQVQDSWTHDEISHPSSHERTNSGFHYLWGKKRIRSADGEMVDDRSSPLRSEKTFPSVARGQSVFESGYAVPPSRATLEAPNQSGPPPLDAPHVRRVVRPENS